MSRKESNILALSFIIITCLVFGAYVFEERKINNNTESIFKNSDAIFQNTQAIKDILEMERDYQKKGRSFMGASSNKIDSILKNQKELIKLLKQKK